MIWTALAIAQALGTHRNIHKRMIRYFFMAFLLKSFKAAIRFPAGILSANLSARLLSGSSVIWGNTVYISIFLRPSLLIVALSEKLSTQILSAFPKKITGRGRRASLPVFIQLLYSRSKDSAQTGRKHLYRRGLLTSARPFSRFSVPGSLCHPYLPDARRCTFLYRRQSRRTGAVRL